jgi:hypothetical protein
MKTTKLFPKVHYNEDYSLFGSHTLYEVALNALKQKFGIRKQELDAEFLRGLKEGSEAKNINVFEGKNIRPIQSTQKVSDLFKNEKIVDFVKKKAVEDLQQQKNKFKGMKPDKQECHRDPNYGKIKAKIANINAGKGIERFFNKYVKKPDTILTFTDDLTIYDAKAHREAKEKGLDPYQYVRDMRSGGIALPQQYLHKNFIKFKDLKNPPGLVPTHVDMLDRLPSDADIEELPTPEPHQIEYKKLSLPGSPSPIIQNASPSPPASPTKPATPPSGPKPATPPSGPIEEIGEELTLQEQQKLKQRLLNELDQEKRKIYSRYQGDNPKFTREDKKALQIQFDRALTEAEDPMTINAENYTHYFNAKIVKKPKVPVEQPKEIPVIKPGASKEEVAKLLENVPELKKTPQKPTNTVVIPDYSKYTVTTLLAEKDTLNAQLDATSAPRTKGILRAKIQALDKELSGRISQHTGILSQCKIDEMRKWEISILDRELASVKSGTVRHKQIQEKKDVVTSKKYGLDDWKRFVEGRLMPLPTTPKKTPGSSRKGSRK